MAKKSTSKQSKSTNADKSATAKKLVEKSNTATGLKDKSSTSKSATSKSATNKSSKDKKAASSTPELSPPAALDPTLEFLQATHPAVRSQMAETSNLPTFLESVQSLSLDERKQIVSQAILLISENFVHLPHKESMHGVAPVQKLKLIQHQLARSTPKSMGSEYQFHRDMLEVFTSVRDLHTNYLLPEPFAEKVAFLPFDIEEYTEDGRPQYLASHFVQGFSHRHFKRGVKIITWNGVPIRRAVEVSANEHAGSNLAARYARGIEGLTLRPLQGSLPPDALWVDIGYEDLDGVSRTMQQEWLVTPLVADPSRVDANAIGKNAACLGTDIQADILQRAKKMLFAPQIVAEEQKVSKKPAKRQKPAAEGLESSLPGIFAAKSVKTSAGTFGYIRIFTFNIDDPDAFIKEFITLIELLPQNGLIIDVRGNGGGHIFASEGLLQTLTPVEITPEPTQFINTALNARICDRHRANPVGIDLSPWVDSILDSVQTGAVYSRGFPITPPEFANQIGQKYHGPVVLITDARCYSATDIFAAGFRDHNIGHILGVDANMGAGGANVWTHGLLQALLTVPEPADRETPYQDLPKGASMRVAIRRTLRVGALAGTPLEDLGVVPDSLHAMTKQDLLEANLDLINQAGDLLKQMPVRELSVKTQKTKSSLSVNATTAGLSRLDVYIDGRPVTTLDIEPGEYSFEFELPANAQQLMLAGYENNEYVAARKIEI